MPIGKKVVWVLADEHSGNVSQCIGVAEALDLGYEVKRIFYNGWARLPNRILGSNIWHVVRDSAQGIRPPWPDVVIACGRRTVSVARHIKQASVHPVFLVQLMWPGKPTRGIDLISTPLHDEIVMKKHVVRTLGAPHNITKKILAEAAVSWEGYFDNLSRPRIAVLVGGDTRRTKFTPSMARDLGFTSSALARALGGSLMVSTSRRTSALALRVLTDNLEGEMKMFNWNDGHSRNPYLGYLACSDAVVVTGDSMSMCTESCSTGRPVFIYSPSGLATKKHERLHKSLYKYGAARPFPVGPVADSLLNWTYHPINDAVLIADEIRERLETLFGQDCG